jgi:hypothetical protein
MDEMARPIATAQIATGRRRYEIRPDDGGWMLHQELSDMMDAGRITTSKIKANTTIEFGDKEVSDWCVVNNGDISGMCLRMIAPATTEALILETYEHSTGYFGYGPNDATIPFGSVSECWEFQSSADGLHMEQTQKYQWKEVGGVKYPVISCFGIFQDEGLCPNLHFVAGIRRAGMSQDTITWWEAYRQRYDLRSRVYYEEPNNCPRLGTNIGFGDEGYSGVYWNLFIPLRGKPLLEMCSRIPGGGVVRTPVAWTGGDLSAVDTASMSDNGVSYRIGVLGDCICVSEGDWDSGFAYYRPPNVAQPIVASGSIHMTNFPGMMTGWLYPLVPPRTPSHDPWILSEPLDLFGAYAAERTSYRVYGTSLTAQLQTVWPTSPPDWWPSYTKTDTVWFPDLAPDGYTIVGDEMVVTEYEKYAEWPPIGPPGEWPLTPPWDWPSEEQWPPVDESGDLRACPDPVQRADPDLSGGDVTFNYIGVGSDDPQTRLQWRLIANPTIHHPDGADVITYTTPFIEAVQVSQSAAITDNGAPTFSDITAPYQVTVEDELEEQPSSHWYEIEVENNPGAGTNFDVSSLRLGSMVKLWLGTLYKSGTTATDYHGTYVLIQTPRTFSKGTLALTDLYGMICLCDWDFGPMDFREWDLHDAMSMVMNLLGIGSAWYDFEDLGVTLKGKDKWKSDIGDNVGAILTNLAVKGGHRALLRYDPTQDKLVTVCPYCLTKRTAENYLTHQDAGWLSTGCLAADVARAGETGVDKILYAYNPSGVESLDIIQDITVEETALKSGEFANRVTVVGADVRGFPRWYRLTNQDAIGPDTAPGAAYVGWPISHVEQDRGLESASAVRARTWDVYGKMATRHTVLRSVKGSWITDLSPGHVVQVYGAAHQGAHGKKYRVLGVKPNPVEMSTTILAREMV